MIFTDRQPIVITEALLQALAEEQFGSRLTEVQMNVAEEIVLERLKLFLKHCVQVAKEDTK